LNRNQARPLNVCFMTWLSELHGHGRVSSRSLCIATLYNAIIKTSMHYYTHAQQTSAVSLLISGRTSSIREERFAKRARPLPVARIVDRFLRLLALHDDAFGIGWRHQTLFSRDLYFILSLFLLDFFREPFLHETESSVQHLYCQSKLTSGRPYRVNLAVSMFNTIVTHSYPLVRRPWNDIMDIRPCRPSAS
jgi:hypothetical protein